jgi:23S rRNA (pseudouridine1915-N3)-methyltransferase
VQIQILAVGKIKEDYLKNGINDYLTRISKYAKTTVTEVAEEDIASGLPREIMSKEAKKLLKYLQAKENRYVVVLDRTGMELSSEDMSSRMETMMVNGKSNFMFVIGGALGLDESIVKIADTRLSLSRLTFTHQMARFILLEQIYRAIKIMKNEPYHY